MSSTQRNKPCPCRSGLKFKKCCGLSKKAIKRQISLLNSRDGSSVTHANMLSSMTTRIQNIHSVPSLKNRVAHSVNNS